MRRADAVLSDPVGADSVAADPIVAIATAPGRGAVGIVRVSGSDLSRFLPMVFDRPTPPRQAVFGRVVDAEGQSLDEGLALYFPAPNSYTGESVLELQVHGGPVVLQMVLARCLEAASQAADPSRRPLPGLRLARPGEFTERAFLNGRMDLAQAEAVADLIDASTATAARSAVRSLQGAFSRDVTALQGQLEDLRILVEATLDFPEEDIDFVRAADCSGRVSAMAQRLATVLAQAQQGRLLRDGITVAIVGQPNVGKSSLLNALAGADLAIVTPIAGTTRDRLRETIQVHGIPVQIMDTAGLRETTDMVEGIGVARAWQSVDEADVVLVVHDLSRQADAGYQAQQRRIEAQLRARAGTALRLDVGNKADLMDSAMTAAAVSAATPEAPANPSLPRHPPPQVPFPTMAVSAQTGAGLASLRAALAEAAGWQPSAEGVFLARERHLQALRESASHVQAAQDRLSHPHPALDLLAEDLRLAHRALGRITGETSADDLLGAIFSRFCIGK